MSMIMEAKFKPIDVILAETLLKFSDKNNINKSINVDGEIYTLTYISKGYNPFIRSRSRGVSIYFKHKRSIIRISDHWTKSVGYDRKKKFNCGDISGKKFIMNGYATRVYYTRYSGKQKLSLLAGKCGLVVLNKICDHFKNKIFI